MSESSRIFTQALDQCRDLALAGGKAINLGKMLRAGFPVPDGFVITTQAYRARVTDEIREAYRNLGGGLVAVRSSATAEDLASASMAGQYETILNVEGEENVLQAVKQCWASAESPRTRAYFAEHGIDPARVAMAVVVQRLVAADVAGVLFTVNPNDDGDDQMLLEASWGLGESVVSGRVQPDVLQLDRQTGRVISANIGDKKTHLTAGATSEEAVDDSRRTQPCLSGRDVCRLWQLGQRVAAHFGTEQDIEWAISGGEIYVLQARPITTRSNVPVRRQLLQSTKEQLTRQVRAGRGPWVLHNLAETLQHPTPLTWSIIQPFMSGSGGFGIMYRQAGFQPAPAMDREGFLDLIGGRIYMDASRAPQMFFEGFPFAYDVQKLKDDPQASQSPPTIPCGSIAARRRASRQLRSVEAKLRSLSITLDHTLRQEIFPEIEAYVARSRPIDLQSISIEELIGFWQQHEKLVLDTFAPQTLLPGLICGMALADLTQFLRENSWDDDADELAQFLSAGGAPNRTAIADAELHEVAQGRRSLETWLAQHGHRAAGEFDLSFPRWREQPQAAREMAQRLNDGESPVLRHQRTAEAIAKRVRELESKLGSRDRAEFHRRLDLLRRYIAFREDGKDFFMLGYGLLRNIALEAGRRLQIGPDVFYLTREELFDALRIGYAPLGLVEQRKNEHRAQERLILPRVIDAGAVEILGRSCPIQTSQSGYKALVLSSGQAIGPARIVKSPSEVKSIERGSILVCPSTDPSWTPLFASAAGLVMECGGALSHGAIVAREMGLPAVVVPDAMRLFKDGESICVDARAGWAGPASVDAVVGPKRDLLPPPPGRKERRATAIRNICAAFWASFLLSLFAFPSHWVHDPTIAFMDYLLWPLVYRLGRPATVATVAGFIAILPLLVQKWLTDNPRLLEAKRRAAALGDPAQIAAVQFRTFMASLVPVGILLGPMVLPFVWFQQRMDPASYSAPAGSAVQIVAMVDGEWNKPVTIAVPNFVTLDETTPASRSLPPLRPALERLLALYREPRNDPAQPWELQAAPDLGRQQTAADLQAYLDAGIPPQGLTWQIRPPVDFSGQFTVRVQTEAHEPVTVIIVLGDRIPPAPAVAIGTSGSPIRQLRVVYPRSSRQESFLPALHLAGRSIDVGWLWLYLIVYLPALFITRKVLNIARIMIGNFVNSLLDNLIATGDRLLDVPLFMILCAMGIVGMILLLILRRFPRLAGAARFGLMGLMVVSAAFFVDRKLMHVQDQLSALRLKLTADTFAQTKPSPKAPERRQAFLFDLDAAQKALVAQFHDVNVRPTIYDEPIDVVQTKITGWPAQVYLAVIDLTDPAVQIKLGTGLVDKTLTSAFARENDCAVAINGEAGMSPGPRAGLGLWSGHMVDHGNVILTEQTGNPRPFLSFNKQNRPSFTSISASNRAVDPQSFNVIWGRLDVLVNGQLPGNDNGDRQPRTAMAINQDGTRLYLMVVDGRQPRYSIGFTHSEVGHFLQAFGGYNGMLCDEGGSSCIYLKQSGGISNIPSDGQGIERPTYTHFGITLK